MWYGVIRNVCVAALDLIQSWVTVVTSRGNEVLAIHKNCFGFLDANFIVLYALLASCGRERETSGIECL